MTSLERRALLGDKKAQEECTEKELHYRVRVVMGKLAFSSI